MKRNTQNRASPVRNTIFLCWEEEEEKFASAQTPIWFGAIFFLRGWEIANPDICGRTYALFRDKFHATDARRARVVEKVAEAFDFNSRVESCMTWMESGRDQTLEKETLERQFERLSFNVRDEQEIFPPLRPECRRNPTAIWGDSRERLWSRQLDKFLCVMCCLCRGSNE